MFRRLSLIFFVAGLTACASQPDEHGMQSQTFSPRHLIKGDMDRVADAVWQETFNNLLLLADKLYRRNPKEWQKSKLASREEALENLRQRRPNPAFEGKKEGEITLLAFSESYQGDRVAAFIEGLLGMLEAAFEYKKDFYLLDNLQAQKIYNLARNIEIAAWKLSNNQEANGLPWLLSNETTGPVRNLSFEREFGRLVGRLDLHVKFLVDKSGRTVTRFTQSLASALFIPIGFLR